MTAAVAWAGTWRKQPTPWLVREQTVDVSTYGLDVTVDSLLLELPQVSRDAARDYLDRNVKSILLGSQFAFPIHIAGEQEISRVETGPRWSPDIFAVSRPGFDRSRTKAVIYVDYWCGGLCGRGFRLLMERRGTDWVVTQQKQIWIA